MKFTILLIQEYYYIKELNNKKILYNKFNKNINID